MIRIRGVVERGKLRVRDFYADLDAHLADVPFVASEQFSAADITALVTVDFATKAITSRYPRTTKPRGSGTDPFLRVLACCRLIVVVPDDESWELPVGDKLSWGGTNVADKARGASVDAMPATNRSN